MRVSPLESFARRLKPLVSSVSPTLYTLRWGSVSISSAETLNSPTVTAMERERAVLLVSGGFPADYTDEKYACEKCRDTGYLGTEICSCLKKAYMEEHGIIALPEAEN